jgi:hypothetical protein
MGVQKKKIHDPFGADDEDINNLDQLAAPVKNIEVNYLFLNDFLFY